MNLEYLINQIKKANGGFIVITLHLEDPNKPGKPVAQHYASKNLDFETVTNLLQDSVKERKKVTAKNADKNKASKHGNA